MTITTQKSDPRFCEVAFGDVFKLGDKFHLKVRHSDGSPSSVELVTFTITKLAHDAKVVPVQARMQISEPA